MHILRFYFFCDILNKILDFYRKGGFFVKKFLFTFVLALALLFTAYHFRDEIIDFLPIDQSGWNMNEYGRCYLDEDGDPVTGWLNIDGKRYYFDAPGGGMHTGWLEEGGKRYYLNTDGTLVSKSWVEGVYLNAEGNPHTGWLEWEDETYYLDETGIPVTGWQELEGKRIYFGEDGTTASGWLELEDGRYYLNADGTMYTGWLEEDGQRFYLNDLGHAVSGWVDTPEGRFFLDEMGSPATGLVETEEGTWFFNEDGTPYTGWIGTDEARRYFDTDGKMYTGWLEDNGQRYYLREDGSPAVGKLEIDGETYFFSSTGMNFIMVNPWNPLPEDFEVELVESPGALLDPVCKDALEKMLSDCREAGFYPQIVSSYRSIADQTANLQRMVKSYQDQGYSYSQAYAAATQIVAVPGTSEHHLGLAFDIVDSGYTKLDHQQAETRTQKWLMENCWKYGFIIRYPENTTDITGIIWEPWHYRYVGLELAAELHELGDIALEVYIDNLTNDGTTCGGKLVEMEIG